MEKATLLKYIKLNYSTYDISEKTNKSQTTVRHWLKKHKLKTKFPFYQGRNKKKYSKRSKITCSCCSIEKPIKNFYPKKNRNGYHTYCKDCLSKQIIIRQQKFKELCVEYKGGKCCSCGYKKYLGALEFHHINPKEKDFMVSRSSRNNLNAKIKKELDKCLLVCSNCHREIHAGLIDVQKLILKSPRLESNQTP